MSEWEETTLGEISELIPGFAFKSSWFGDQFPDKVIKITNINENGIHNSELTGVDLSAVDKSRLEKCKATKGDFVLAMTGSIGKIGRIEDGVAYLNQRVLMVREKHGIDKRFLYYVLRTKQFLQHMLTHIDSHSVQANISAGSIGEYSFALPSLPTQRHIAAVLSALDDKIELNNRINANLDTQAQALFRSWFVDFEPWGGAMPEGWREGKLGEFCECVLGGTPARDNPSFWNGDIPWINSGKVNEFRIVEPSEKITKAGLDGSAAKLLPKRTTVIAITGATLGQISLVEIETSANQSVVGIPGSSILPSEYVYPFICQNRDVLLSFQTGGAQQHINKQNVSSLDVVVPDVETMKRYVSVVRPIFDKIAVCCFQNRSLTALRDALLPKLMSGEIDVEKVEIPA